MSGFAMSVRLKFPTGSHPRCVSSRSRRTRRVPERSRPLLRDLYNPESHRSFHRPRLRCSFLGTSLRKGSTPTTPETLRSEVPVVHFPLDRPSARPSTLRVVTGPSGVLPPPVLKTLRSPVPVKTTGGRLKILRTVLGWGNDPGWEVPVTFVTFGPEDRTPVRGRNRKDPRSQF